MTCPSCGELHVTMVKAKPGPMAWIICGGCIFFWCVKGVWSDFPAFSVTNWPSFHSCILGCCLIPFCLDNMKVYTHQCANCKAHLGVYKGTNSLG